MAKQPTSDFDQLAVAFADYGTTVRGYVRYQLTRRNLEPYVRGKSLQVLDVGGGSGGDTAWLAELGHQVTYLEPSTEQRRFAQRRFNFLLSDRARPLVHMAGTSLAELSLQDRQFDLVLVHAVAMYQKDAMAFLHEALAFVKPGGFVSIIEKGFYGTEIRDVRTHNFSDLARLHRTGRSINDLKVNVQTFKPEQLEQFLEDEKFVIDDWSGIRLLTDNLNAPVDSVDPKRIKLLLKLEYEHGHHPAIRGEGQLLHFIAHKD